MLNTPSFTFEFPKLPGEKLVAKKIESTFCLLSMLVTLCIESRGEKVWDYHAYQTQLRTLSFKEHATGFSNFP
jgi:hypothetical protein